MQLKVVEHPVVQARLTTLRRADTPNAEFRRALHQLSTLLIYEALDDIATATVEIETPLAPTMGTQVVDSPVVVPILRAGLGMLEAARLLLPDALVGFVGARRDEETFQPQAYLDTVPPLGEGPALVLDPMLATGGSLVHACQLLRDREAGPITIVCVLASPEGVGAVDAAIDDVRIVTAAVDERLNEVAYIVPGLGDAGDRQFGDA